MPYPHLYLQEILEMTFNWDWNDGTLAALWEWNQFDSPGLCTNASSAKWGVMGAIDLTMTSNMWYRTV